MEPSSSHADSPRDRGWTLVEPTVSATIDHRPSDGLRARECDQCHEWGRPAWKCAAICVACFARDYERAYRQRAQQVLAAVAATRAEWGVR